MLVVIFWCGREENLPQSFQIVEIVAFLLQTINYVRALGRFFGRTANMWSRVHIH